MTTEIDHKHLAALTYNQCWKLLNSDRDDAQDRNLIGFALTSRYHWQHVGGFQELAIADWMVSRVFAATGHPELAMDFARESLRHDSEKFPMWLRASLNEGIARAHASSGETLQRDSYVKLALDDLEKEPDREDAELIRTQLQDLID